MRSFPFHHGGPRRQRPGAEPVRPPEQRDVLVFSGGAARGAVQVGMLGELFAAGLRPSGLVGTSVGALNAVHVAAHPTTDGVGDLAERWLGLTRKDVFPGGLSRLGHVARHRQALWPSHGLARLIDRWAPVDRLEDLPLPTLVTTTHLGTASAVYHRVGDLRQVLLASAALPAIFAPVHLPEPLGGTAPHVDGGVADLVPVTGAADLAPTRVIVLDASVAPRTRPERTPLHVLVASLGAAMRVRPLPDLGPGVEVHVLRAPDLGTGMQDFSRTREHLALGRASARAWLDALAAAPRSPSTSPTAA